MNSSLQSHERIPPGCDIYAVYGRLEPSHFYTRACLIFVIIVNILTFPFTTVLNALVVIAVAVKSRLRAHKSRILLSAALASTDFVVGLVLQPAFSTMSLTTFLDDTSNWVCSLQAFTRIATSCLWNASLLHLGLLSGERFLAMKYSFAYINQVTTSRLVVSSVLAWLLSIFLQIPFAFDKTVFLFINSVFIGLTITFIIFCHITVYQETRRHERQLAAQQVTQEAREQIERDKKTLKLTFIIIAVLMFCYLPLAISRIIFFSIKPAKETKYIVGYLGASTVLFNSLLNPIIYCVKIRQFRIAFIELTCRTANITEAEAIDLRVFRMLHAEVKREAQKEEEQKNPQITEQSNVTEVTDVTNDDFAPKHN